MDIRQGDKVKVVSQDIGTTRYTISPHTVGKVYSVVERTGHWLLISTDGFHNDWIHVCRVEKVEE